MKNKITARDFLDADKETKKNIIEMVGELDSHNFISKEALVEIVKYQCLLIKEYYRTIREVADSNISIGK